MIFNSHDIPTTLPLRLALLGTVLHSHGVIFLCVLVLINQLTIHIPYKVSIICSWA
jgi:hypothetical protein